jgi:hypothetical protein
MNGRKVSCSAQDSETVYKSSGNEVTYMIMAIHIETQCRLMCFIIVVLMTSVKQEIMNWYTTIKAYIKETDNINIFNKNL